MRRLSALACAVAFVPAVFHEVTHYAVAWPWTDDAGFRVEVFGGEAVAVWQPIENPALRAFAFLAPTVFGLVLAGIWVVSGVELSGWRWPLGIGLALYTLPSPADVRGALGRQDVQTATAGVDSRSTRHNTKP